MDVLELDAASRTKVDEMRELLDGVRYAPVEARYKVYIIDEVHMLSTAAFNALLKTLEEPPPHAKFIFATTEIRKVPVTILSRTQRLDLRRVEPDLLVKNLEMICENEGARALGLGALVLRGEVLQHGQRERRRLAGAGLGDAQHVAALQQRGNGARLDRRGHGVLGGVEGTQQRLGEAEIRKRNITHWEIVLTTAKSLAALAHSSARRRRLFLWEIVSG